MDKIIKAVNGSVKIGESGQDAIVKGNLEVLGSTTGISAVAMPTVMVTVSGTTPSVLNLVANKHYIVDMSTASGDVTVNAPSGAVEVEFRIKTNYDTAVNTYHLLIAGATFSQGGETGTPLRVGQVSDWVLCSWDNNNSYYTVEDGSTTVARTLAGSWTVDGDLTVESEDARIIVDKTSSTVTPSILFGNDSASNFNFRVGGESSDLFTIATSATNHADVANSTWSDQVYINGSGNVGIGSSPSSNVKTHIYAITPGEVLKIETAGAEGVTQNYISFWDAGAARRGYMGYGGLNENMVVKNNRATGTLELKTAGGGITVSATGDVGVGGVPASVWSGISKMVYIEDAIAPGLVLNDTSGSKVLSIANNNGVLQFADETNSRVNMRIDGLGNLDASGTVVSDFSSGTNLNAAIIGHKEGVNISLDNGETATIQLNSAAGDKMSGLLVLHHNNTGLGCLVFFDGNGANISLLAGDPTYFEVGGNGGTATVDKTTIRYNDASTNDITIINRVGDGRTYSVSILGTRLETASISVS